MLAFFLLVPGAQASWDLVETWGSRGWQPGQMQMPGGLDISGSNIYVADIFNDRVSVFSLSGVYKKTIGGPGRLSSPYDVSVAPDGTVFVANTYKNQIVRYKANGQFIRSYGSYGSKKGQFKLPGALEVTGNRIWVADSGNSRVQALNYKGQVAASFATPNFPWSFGLDIYNSNIYLAGNKNLSDGPPAYQVAVFSTAGQRLKAFAPLGSASGQVSNTRGLFVNSSGVFVTSSSSVELFALDGTWSESVATSIAPGPFGVVGSGGDIFVSSGNNTVSVYRPATP